MFRALALSILFFCSALLLLQWLDAATDLSQLPALTHFIVTKFNASLLSHFQNEKAETLTGSKNSRFRKILTVPGRSLVLLAKLPPPKDLRRGFLRFCFAVVGFFVAE